MVILTVGIDLAKNVFAVHGVDESVKPVLVRPQGPRAKLLELIANMPQYPLERALFTSQKLIKQFSKFAILLSKPIDNCIEILLCS